MGSSPGPEHVVNLFAVDHSAERASKTSLCKFLYPGDKSVYSESMTRY
jgi:hypothetical protein